MARTTLILISFILMVGMAMSERYICIENLFVADQENYLLNADTGVYCQLPAGFLVKHISFKTASPTLSPGATIALGYTNYPQAFIPYDLNLTTDMINDDNYIFSPKMLFRGVKSLENSEIYLTLTPTGNILGGQLEIYIDGDLPLLV